jgi:hypothetical protein
MYIGQFIYISFQERLTAMEAMSHPYFFPVVKEKRLNPMSGSPTQGLGVNGGGMPSSPIMSPGSTPNPGTNQN